MEISGVIANIRYRSDESGWTVLSIRNGGGELITAVGVVPHVNEGDCVELSGAWSEHPFYGEQLKISSCTVKAPTSNEAVFAYLSSGFIKGVGKATAKQLLNAFGAETLDIIKSSPEKLTKLSGFGPKKAKLIHDSYVEKLEMQDVVIGMQQLGFSLAMTMKIYKLYGAGCVQKIKNNPYILIDDVDSIGFKTADKIAIEAGYELESTFRIRSGVKYALSVAASEGNTCLPRDMLLMYASNNVLNVHLELVEAVLDSMILEGELVEKRIDETVLIFLPAMHHLEADSSVMLFDLTESAKVLPLIDIAHEIERMEKKHRVTLADKQREAVERSLSDGVLIVTGGPGTGKTTILRFIIELMERQKLEFELAAPTGRAAKRISDTSGREARTIHRLLEYSASAESFSRNRDNPLEADAVIIDEMSMVDIALFHSLLKALAKGTRLIMVGDVDQLPSVGPGNVLRDIVESGTVPVIRLNEIFRQAGRSSIVINAHLVNDGKMPELGMHEDFMFYPCSSAAVALESVKNICADYAYLGKSDEIQVLSPMKSNLLGVHNLNTALQQELNPTCVNKSEYKYGDTVFRVGDRVMQIKNNYDLEWVKKVRGKAQTEGAGVFNGDIGTIMRINKDMSNMTVLFDDERTAEYNFTQLEELELAYCISVHKSQGSEFSTIVLPLVSGPMMLFNRNILYTAITRARNAVFIFGTEESIRYMVNNASVRKRYSALRDFLIERKAGLS
ncbi:MAG: ATP-dependent RecD-like DNA helicase [Clostridia bacterium]|nr:ATP-dependent RecD-like DNA helicase [Clostridia bacterium]